MPPEAKKLKEELKDEKELKDEIKQDTRMIKQNKEFHCHKENMRQLLKKEIELLLLDNQQEIPEGYDPVRKFLIILF